MPKRPTRNKQTDRPGTRPRTARDLICARLPALAQRARTAPQASEWYVTMAAVLGRELANKVNGATLKAGKLTVFAESSVWAARLRYALAEAEMKLREGVPEIRTLVVRVRPRSAAAT